MKASVNLDNLHDMTGNDTEMEQELFRTFIDSSEECLAFLTAHCEVGAEAQWRKRVHAWKGISLNLGAERLGKLCRHAQDNYTASIEEKLHMLEEIGEEYRQVKSYLEKL